MHSNLQELKQYSPASLYTGKVWYIAYFVFNPESNKLEKKRIKLMHIKNAVERRKCAIELIKRLNVNLANGWNPFIDPEAKKSYHKLSEAANHFLKIAEKKLAEDTIRQNTYKDYVSYLRNFQNWLNEKGYGDIYVYKLDKELVSTFLEYIYIGRDRTAQTRNNYLNMLRIFAGFLTENNYTKFKFTDGLNPIKKGAKQRTIISKIDMAKLNSYLEKENKNYLLACQVLYYTFIRPKEMSYIQLKHISFANKTIYVPGLTAKNRKDATITMPKQLIELMLDLKIYEYPSEFFLFSDYFKPGEKYKDEKHFRDLWLKIRRKLKFPASYKFYSLKDTGITDMLTNLKDTRQVRDQARHSNISITDIYTPHGNTVANQNIVNIDYGFGD